MSQRIAGRLPPLVLYLASVSAAKEEVRDGRVLCAPTPGGPRNSAAGAAPRRGRVSPAASLPATSARAVEQLGSLGGHFTALAANAVLAYLSEGDALAIFDIADPSHIARLARLPLDMIIGSIEVVNGIAYVAGGRRSTDRGALKVVDVRDPLRPLLRGTAETPGFAQGVAVAGGYAYVASDNPIPGSPPGFFQAFDIRNPDWPTLRSTYAIVCDPTGWCGGSNGYPRAISIVGSLAYVVGEATVHIFDVQNPTSLRRISRLPVSGFIRWVSVAGDNAYVISDKGLEVIDSAGEDGALGLRPHVRLQIRVRLL